MTAQEHSGHSRSCPVGVVAVQIEELRPLLTCACRPGRRRPGRRRVMSAACRCRRVTIDAMTTAAPSRPAARSTRYRQPRRVADELLRVGLAQTLGIESLAVTAPGPHEVVPIRSHPPGRLRGRPTQPGHHTFSSGFNLEIPPGEDVHIGGTASGVPLVSPG